MMTRWTWLHTLFSIVWFVIPFASGIYAALNPDMIVIGNWNFIEMTWTGWASIGLALATVKGMIIYGDLHATYALKQGWRQKLNLWWAFVNAVHDELSFVMWIIAGYISGMLPTITLQVEDKDVIASTVVGITFMVVQSFALGKIVFTLMARVVLGNRVPPMHLHHDHHDPDDGGGRI